MITDDQVPLFKAAKHVLESWGLGPIRQSSETPEIELPPLEDSIVTEVKFSSMSINGSLVGLVSKSQVEKIVASMLGPNDAMDVSLIKDAVGELINTITGNYLTEAFGSKVVFDLGSPRNIPAAEWKLPTPVARAVPGLTETTLSLEHDGSVIILAAEYLKPELA